MKPTFGVRVLVAICLLACAAMAQQTIANGVTYTQNFDSFGTANVTFTDNTTITGVYAARSTVIAKTFTAGAGTVGTSGYYNFGVAAGANRAMGWVNGNGITTYSGLRLYNAGSNAITSLQIQYAGEQWRDGNGGAETMAFSYQVGATVTSLTTGTWTNVPALLFTSPNAPGGANSWNGDLAANRTAFNQTIAVNIPAGQEIMLRWSSLGSSAQGDGIGVDDISITAIGPTAADATISGRVTDAYGRAISSAAISVQDLTGVSKVVYTNTFGYYSVKGLEVGQTYVLGVSARRYSFANPTMVVDLGDNLEGANFVANR
jgi:Carboxypeptidase regulatory-like domain